MNKLLINATKNYGSKIENALTDLEMSNVIDGVYISIADFPRKQLLKLREEFSNRTNVIFEFPIFYILEDNLYIARNKMNNLMRENKLKGTNTNKLEYLMDNAGFKNFTDFPLAPSSYVKNREYILNLVEKFYMDFSTSSNIIVAPTFMLRDLNSWKEIMIEDIFLHSQNYAAKNKLFVTCSFIIDFEFLDKEDVASRIANYFSRYDRFNMVSLTLTINKVGANSYTKQQYLTYMNLIRDLNFKGIKVCIQNAGLKDVVLSVLNIESFGVGWSSSYRGLNLEQRKITDHETTSFGIKTKKILLSRLMSEIPLSYLEVFTAIEREEFFTDGLKNIDSVQYTWLEQKYWKEFIKITNYDEDLIMDKNKSENAIIVQRIESFEKKLESAKDLLETISQRLKSKGRFEDSNRVTNEQMSCIISFREALNEFRNSIFDF